MKTASGGLQAYLLNPPANILFVDLWTITLVNGVILRICSGDQDVVYSTNRFVAGGPTIERSKIKMGVGLTVDEIDMVLQALPTDQLSYDGGVTYLPILSLIARGDFDGAGVRVERLFMPTYGDTSLGTLIQFVGTIADVTELGRAHSKMNVRSRIELLNIQLPRNLIQAGCRHTLFDAGCTLVAASFAVSGSALSGSNKSAIVTGLSQATGLAAPTLAPTLSVNTPSSGVNLIVRTVFAVATYVSALGESLGSVEAHIVANGNQVVTVHSPSSIGGAVGWNCYIGASPGDEMKQNDTPIAFGTDFTEAITGAVQGSALPQFPTNGYFDMGRIVFTSGQNSKQHRVVKSYLFDGAHNVVTVIPPLPFTPAPGDAFTIYPGCDKQKSTCGSAKFGNLVNFGGFPFVPDPTLGV